MRGARLDGRGGTHHRGRVDAEHAHRGARPDPVGDGAGARQGDAVQHPGVGPEPLLVVRRTTPRPVARQALDGRVAVRVVQRVEHPDQRHQGVRGRAAELAGVQVARQGRHPHLDQHHAAQRRGHGGHPDPEVPGVADQHDVRREQVRVLLGVPLQAAGALLLRALHDHLDGHRHPALTAQRPQRGEVHQDAALAVRRAAPEPPAVPLGQLERRRQPRRLVQRRLHVVVRVEQHGRRAHRAGQQAVDRLRAVRRVEQRHVLEPLVLQRRRRPAGRLRALLRRELPRVEDRAVRDQFGEFGAGARHQRGDGPGQRGVGGGTGRDGGGGVGGRLGGHRALLLNAAGRAGAAGDRLGM
jgi:hypothetical protein